MKPERCPVTLPKNYMKTPETIAVIPAFNEESTIGGVVRAALRASLVNGVILVDDGSTDNTLEKAKEAAEVECTVGPQKPFYTHAQDQNYGKTETLQIGVEKYAKVMGGEALKTLVFLDADSSPIWSRDTTDNMKLWQKYLYKIFGEEAAPSDIMADRHEAFITLLAQYIDEIVRPVALGEQVMRTGMYQRNIVTDTILAVADKDKKGGHAGNRAISLDVWNGLADESRSRGITLSRWQIESALNAYTDGQITGTFMMYGVVNVGSRVKAGGFFHGLKRMAEIHGQAPKTSSLFRR